MFQQNHHRAITPTTLKQQPHSLLSVKSCFLKEIRRFSVNTGADGFESFSQKIHFLFRLNPLTTSISYRRPSSPPPSTAGNSGCGGWTPIVDEESFLRAKRECVLGQLMRVRLEKVPLRSTSSVAARPPPPPQQQHRHHNQSQRRVRSYPSCVRELPARCDSDSRQRRVRLHKEPAENFGFSFRSEPTPSSSSAGDGAEASSPPYRYFVDEVKPGGVSAKSRLVAPRDEIVEVNGAAVVGLSSPEVFALIVERKTYLVLLLKPALHQLEELDLA